MIVQGGEQTRAFVALAPALESPELLTARDAAFRASGGEVAHLLVGGARCTLSVNPRVEDPDGQPYGMIGNLVVPDDDDATEALLAEALPWLRARACRRVQGPIVRHTWYAFRAVTSGFDACPRLTGEPWNAPWLVPRLERAGFAPVAWYVSTWTRDSRTQIDRSAEKLAALSSHRYHVREFDPGRPAEELALIHAVTCRSFVRPINYLFVPIGLPEFQCVLGPSGGAIDPGLFLICSAPDGSVAGFCYTTVEGADLASIKTLVVAPEHRGAGVGSALVALTHVRCRERGLSRVVHALMRVGGPSVSISNRGGHEVFRRYEVLERTL